MRDYNKLFLEISPLSSDNRLSSHNWEESDISNVFSDDYEDVLSNYAIDDTELSYKLS